MSFSCEKQLAKDLRQSSQIVGEILNKKKELTTVEAKIEELKKASKKLLAAQQKLTKADEKMQKKLEESKKGIETLTSKGLKLRKSINERILYAKRVHYRGYTLTRLSNLSESELIGILFILDPNHICYLPPISKKVPKDRVEKLKKAATLSPEILLKEI